MNEKKAETYQSITVEHGGRSHTAQVAIRGTRSLEFVVHYAGKSKSDGRKYGTDDEERHNMMVMAEATLLQMVFEREND